MTKRSIFLALIFTGFVVLLVCLFRTQPVHANVLFQETEKYCLNCHNDPNLSITLPSGEFVSLYINADIIHQSLHTKAGIECEACHTNITTYPHPGISFQTNRDLALSCSQVTKSKSL